MANKINIVISVDEKTAAAALTRFSKNVDKTTESTSAFKDSLGRVRDVALGVYLPQLAGKIAGAGLSMLNAAGDFQQGMNIFQEVSGATAAQMQLVSARAEQLGNDITLPGVSARTAADAMIELSKAGLSVNDTLAAGKGVLALAKAGQLDTAQAAEIAANALLAFNLAGSEASRVADLLAAAANASSADVSDMGLALQQSASVAAQTKRPIEDLTTQIALMANNGIKGADAGTSLKTMLSRLSAPTDDAAGLMKSLGVNIYDATGTMKNTRTIIGDFTKALQGKTDAQKNDILYTIFGSDAIRAANIVIGGGIQKYDDMAKSVGKAGAAQELAAAYSKGLKGNVEALNNAVETAGLRLGKVMLPAAESLTGALATGLNPAIDKAFSVGGRLAALVGTTLSPSFRSLGSSVKRDVLPTLQQLWQGVLKPLATGVGGALVSGLREGANALTFLTTSARPFTAVALGLGAAFATWKVATIAMGVYTLVTALNVATVSTRLMAAAMLLLNVNPIILAITATVGVLTTLWSLQGLFASSTDRTSAAIDAHKAAQDRLAQSNRDAKLAQDALNGAVMDAEGASLRVEQAQRYYNDTVSQYGPKSLEARQAAYDLKRAQDDLANANANVAAKTRDAQQAQEARTKAEAAVKQTSANIGAQVDSECPWP